MKDEEIYKMILANVKASPYVGDKPLAIFWSGPHNAWKCLDSNQLDPLSWVLYCMQPEPFREGDDDLAVATLGNLFNRKPSWVKAFHIALSSKTNSGTSISGFLMGVKVKKALCTLFPEKVLPPSETSSSSKSTAKTA